jgi:hypothetical protein
MEQEKTVDQSNIDIAGKSGEDSLNAPDKEGNGNNGGISTGTNGNNSDNRKPAPKKKIRTRHLACDKLDNTANLFHIDVT